MQRIFELLYLNTWYQVIMSVAALIGALWSIKVAYNKIKIRIVNHLAKMVGVLDITEKQNVIDKKLDRILGELSFNGGKSTKDFIKRVGESMIRVESRQQALFNSPENKQGLFECDKNGMIVWINRQLCYLLGKTPQDLTGTGWFNFISKSQKQAVTDEWEICMSEGRDFIMDLDMVVGNTNKPITIQTTRMTNEANEIIGWFGTFSSRI